MRNDLKDFLPVAPKLVSGALFVFLEAFDRNQTEGVIFDAPQQSP